MRKFLRRLFKTLRIALWLLVLLLLGVLLYLGTAGFPRWLINWIEPRINTERLAFTAQSARLVIDRGAAIALTDVAVFRKKFVGPPVLEARRVTFAFDPVALLRREFCVRRVTISDGALRPELGPAQGPAAPRVPRPFRLWVELRDCELQGLRLDSLVGDLRVDSTGWRAQGLQGTIRNGNLTGVLSGELAYSFARREVNGRVATTGDWRVLKPVMRARRMTSMEELCERFKFGGSPPETTLTFRTGTTNGWYVVEGSFRMQDASYLGVAFLRADGSLRVAGSPGRCVTAIDPLLIVRDDGTARAGFTITTGAERRGVEFSGQCTMDPLAVLRMTGALTNDVSAVWRLKPPYRVFARGWVDLADQRRSDYEATVECGELGSPNLFLENCSFRLHALGLSNTCQDVRGRICGGSFAGTVGFVWPRPPATGVFCRVEGELEGVDFQALAGKLTKQPAPDYRGVLSAKFALQGALGDTAGASWKGDGSLRIKDGRVFMLPLFGGLSKHLARIIPGLDFVLRQTDAKAQFTVADGKVSSDKISVEGEILSVAGHGAYGFDRSLDYLVQIRIMKEHTAVAKILRTATWLLSKLFEFRLRGTLKEPHWYPVNFSPDLLERLGLKSGEAKDEGAPAVTRPPAPPGGAPAP